MLMNGKQCLIIPPSDLDSVSLYFHIPFCTKKCDYCHFFVLPDKEHLKMNFMQGLKKEWLARLPLLEGKKIASIYFGGGTPYLLGPNALGEILSWVKPLPLAEREIEVTLEANPENVTLEGMQAYYDIGINRISIGVQSLDDSLLGSLGRQHSVKKSIEAVEIAAKVGLMNISIDLMYDLPRQTLSVWEKTLKRVESLPIKHLSLYNLTIEPHTVFFKYRDSLRSSIPDQEVSLAMVQMAIESLQEMGLQRYEISAFCKDGLYAKHNVGYWTGRPFLGYGPSAFSYWEGSRFRNIANLSKYVRQLEEGLFPIDFEETLELSAQKRELLAIGLRLSQGVNLAELQLQEETLKVIDRLIADQLLHFNPIPLFGHPLLALTSKGTLFYDLVASEII